MLLCHIINSAGSVGHSGQQRKHAHSTDLTVRSQLSMDGW